MGVRQAGTGRRPLNPIAPGIYVIGIRHAARQAAGLVQLAVLDWQAAIVVAPRPIVSGAAAKTWRSSIRQPVASYRVKLSNHNGPHRNVRRKSLHRPRRTRFHLVHPFAICSKTQTATGLMGCNQRATQV
jgi:hypothetical protein